MHLGLGIAVTENLITGLGLGVNIGMAVKMDADNVVNFLVVV